MDRFERPGWWGQLLGMAAFVLVLGEGVLAGEVTSQLLERACWAMVLSGISGLFLGRMMFRALAEPLPSLPSGYAPPSPSPAAADASLATKESA